MRERIKGVVVVVTVLKRFLSSCLSKSKDSLRKKKKQKCIERGQKSGSQKRKSLLSSNATLSLLHSFARARYTHTHTVLSRSSDTLPHTHAVQTRDDENGKKRGSRSSFSLVVLCESESQGESVVLFFPTGSSFTCAVGEI